MGNNSNRGSALIVAVLMIAGSLGLASSALAQESQVYDWASSEAPALIANESGLVFLGSDKKPWRAYSWNRSGGEHRQGLVTADIDKDGEYEIVGAGKPTFALETNSNPAWSIGKGCDQVIVANFAADDKLDVMCKGSTSLAIYTHDRQKIWSADLGVRLDYCKAGDVNGDLKNDIECKFRGRDSYIRIDSQGKILAESSEESKIDQDGPELDEAQPVSGSILKGEEEFDLNGDGTAEESLLADGNAVVIQSRSKDKAVARIEVGGEAKGALVKNLDSEGNPEIVILTDDDIIVADAKGKKLGTYDADAGNYRRYPVAELDSVYARKFEDNKKATKAVKDAQKKLAKCYEKRVRGNLFVGIGQVILKVYVDDKGKVSEVEKMHSAIRDKKVESCAKGILKGLDYPKYKKPEDEEEDDSGGKATINVVMKFTFADKT